MTPAIPPSVYDRPYDRPFALPPDPIVLDIPVPPSINITRRSHGPGERALASWRVSADKTLLASGQYRAAKKHPKFSRFELEITLSEDCKLDLDNPIKCAIDYLRRIELIHDDSQKYLRKLTVSWGIAPAGARIVLRSAE